MQQTVTYKEKSKIPKENNAALISNRIYGTKKAVTARSRIIDKNTYISALLLPIFLSWGLKGLPMHFGVS